MKPQPGRPAEWLRRVSGRTPGRGLKAPDLTEGGPWLNSRPLSMEELRGRVVLLDFWTYSCLNCLRTLPYPVKWHERYGAHGLVVIGVHTPEFEFEKDRANVEKALKENGINYPVVLDNEYKIWTAYANKYWPRKYLIDSAGRIRYDHIGEGGYAKTEDMIQALIRETDPAVRLPPVAIPVHDHPEGGVCYPITPETYCGYSRGALGNAEGYRQDEVFEYTAPGTLREDTIYVEGQWIAAGEYLEHRRQGPESKDWLALVFHALELNAVMAPTREPARVEIRVDNLAVGEEDAGADIVFEPGGKTAVVVDRPRMYRLFKSAKFAPRLIQLVPLEKGVRFYAFTFAGCR